MATVEKIRRDIEKTREKISEQQKRLRTLETPVSYTHLTLPTILLV